MLTYNKNAKTVAEAFGIKKDAAQDAANGEIDAAIATLQAESMKTKSALDGLKAQREILQTKYNNLSHTNASMLALQMATENASIASQATKLQLETENEGDGRGELG